MTEPRVALYAGTRNIYHDMVVAAKSLLYHDGADRVVFLIEDDEFPEQLPECFTLINVSGQQYFRHDGPNYNCAWTYMVMMRTALTKLFPIQHRMLVLDHDTIVRQPLDELWATDLGDNYYALVQENHITNRTHPYFNFGVGMHNLDQLRKDEADDTIIRSVNTIHYTYCEQDAVNSVCWKRILELPTRFNTMSFNQPHIPEDEVVIRHYAAGLRPLSLYEDYRFFDAMPWTEVLNHKPENIVRAAGWKRYDIINHFIRFRGYTSFLEIGTAQGETYRNVAAPIRVSVDPDPDSMATYRMTSDEFFQTCDDTFDIIFIDGLHECHQAYADVLNALDHLNMGGVIVMHDCLPTSEHMQMPADHYPGGECTGDVWKAFMKVRKLYSYESYTINTDYGCGIIDTSRDKSSDTSDIPDDMDTMNYYDHFVAHPEWMNIKGGIIK